MPDSRLKLELIDGSESAAAERQRRVRDRSGSKPTSTSGGARLSPDMTTNPLATFGQESGKSHSLRTSIMPAVLDPTLLHDLAEGLEFLNRQLDDAESELEQSREQSQAFEQDARRWENEAARLRNEAEETRQALEQLRQEFEDGRDTAQHHQEMFERVLEEMAEIRAARTHLEQLAAEQQRALVLSLELLKRVNEDAPEQAAPDLPEVHDQIVARDAEIQELNSLLAAVTEEGARVDAELVETLAAHKSAQVHAERLGAEIAAARSEALSATVELESAREEVNASQVELARLRQELNDVQLKQAGTPRTEQSTGDVDLAPQVAELENDRFQLAQKLQDADAEIALQNAEVESRGAIIIALENALEEQNSSLRTLEERFLAYAEQVQALQLQRLEMPPTNARSIASKFARAFSPPKRSEKK